MGSKFKLKQSREQWKQKAMERGEIARYQKKENFRLKKERNAYKKKWMQAKQESKQEVTFQKKEDLVFVALQLFLYARLSFRATSRVLHLLAPLLGILKAPCPQTIINWVTRLSISRFQNCFYVENRIKSDPFANGMIWMLDLSIGLGAEKILVVTALNAKHHQFSQKAPTLRDLKCVAVGVAPSWTGEAIANFLEKVILRVGRPLAYLKDGGTDLAKATRLLEERGFPSLLIDDLSHKIANLFKQEYQGHPKLETLISACGQASKNLKQSFLAFLAPPKVSVKARFMNLSPLIKWAKRVLMLSPSGRAAKGSTLFKLRTALGEISECKAFIRQFLRDANPLLKCQEILKNKGLSQETYQECLLQIQELPQKSSIRVGFTQWLEHHLKLAEEFELVQFGMPMSTDPLESLFGVAKRHGTGEIKDANRIATRIPSLCGELRREDAKNILKITVKEQQELMDSFPSLLKQRRLALSNLTDLDQIQQNHSSKTLELIPYSKNWEKGEVNQGNSIDYDIKRVLLKQSPNRPEMLYTSDLNRDKIG